MKFILVPVLLTLTFGAAAQPQVKVKSDTTETVTYDGNKFRVQTAPARANWFIGLQGGGQLIFGDHDKQCKLGDRIAPALDIYFGKWFTPVVGGRVRYSGLSFKGATQTDVHSTGKEVPGKGGHGYWLTKQKFSYVEFAGDVMCNLSNAFGGYRPDRFYSAIPYVGLGVGRVTQNPKTTELMGHIGYLSAFRVCDAVDINLDLRMSMIVSMARKAAAMVRVFSLLPLVLPISSNLVASVALRLLPVSFLLSMTFLITRGLSMRPRQRTSVS